MNNLASDSKRVPRRWNVPHLSILIALSMVFCCAGALAQSGAGSIQGTITDSSSAVIPGASIQVVNTATGVVSTTKSNRAGFYQVPALFTGSYTVTITAPKMKSYERSIDLLVAQNAVINAALTPGEVTQQIVVSGDAVQLTTTDNGAITSTLENARINQLPMNTRDLASLMQNTTPGLENGGTQINGLQPEALEYDVDGASTQNELYGGAHSSQQQLIDPDAVQEVRMVANGAGAEYAMPATAVVNTKSGTNHLHGSAFETTRNNVIGVAKNRQDPSNYSAPHLVRNEFGASAGGPIILPHVYHGKDKSFWFFAYERYSLAQSKSVLSKVPTLAMSQGDFSGLVNAAGIQQTIYDPATTGYAYKCGASGKPNQYCRTPFQNNQIPLSEESPVAKVYYQLVPVPTSGANPLVTPNSTSLSPTFSLEPQETVRLDHVFNDNNRGYMRYTQNLNGNDITGGPRNRAYQNIPAGAAVNLSGYSNQIDNTHLASIGFTHIFSPTFFAETIASQQWFNQKRGKLGDDVNYESQLGLPNNFGTTGFPLLGNGGLIFNLGSNQTNTAKQAQIVSSLDENLTKTIGKHQIQFGGRFRHERLSEYPNHAADYATASALPTGLYNTATGASYGNTPQSGSGDASFFLGSAAAYGVNLNPGTFHGHLNEFDAYVQDNYHVSRNLTLNLGVRYEAHPAPWVKYGVMTSFDLKNDALVLSVPASTLIAEGLTTQAVISNLQYIGAKIETPSEAGLPNSLFRNYNLGFEGRAGFAYQLFGGKRGTVIRGAYGKYAYPTRLENWLIYPATGTPFRAAYSQSYTSAAQSVDGLPNELLRYNDPAKFGVMGVNTSNVVDSNSVNSVLPGAVGSTSNSENSPPEAVTQTNLTIEQPFKGNSVLRVSWVWTHASNMEINDLINNAPSAYQWEMATGTLPPTGGASVIGTPQQNTYSTTATRPYDQTTWGGINYYEKTGWSNYNGLQLNYQRLYHHGIAYQISYVFGKTLRAGDNNNANAGNPVTEAPAANYPGVLGSLGVMSSPNGTIYPALAPPPLPAGFPVWADYHAMRKYQLYKIDTALPLQHISFNGIVDLPIGRGKRFLGNANRFVNELVGGFQLAGDGNITSQVFSPNGGYWGATSPLKVYKHRYPVTDCRSGVCQQSYLWFNGYLGPSVLPAPLGNCTTNCVTSLPADYVPDQAPIDNTPGTTYYGTDEVYVTLLNGKTVPIKYDAGPAGGNYLQKTFLSGPFNYSVDLSAFKVFPITEKVNLRFNVDAFNALNVQGWNNPGANGLETRLTSHNTPREIQITARLTF